MGSTFQQVVAFTCLQVLLYQVAFGNKTVLECGKDAKTNLGRSRGANLDKNMLALQAVFRQISLNFKPTGGLVGAKTGIWL